MLLGEVYDFHCWIINKSKLDLSNKMWVYVYVWECKWPWECRIEKSKLNTVPTIIRNFNCVFWNTVHTNSILCRVRFNVSLFLAIITKIRRHVHVPETFPTLSMKKYGPWCISFLLLIKKFRSKTLNLINLQFLTLSVSVLTVSFKWAVFKEKPFFHCRYFWSAFSS